jgi:hypothetical protein
MGGRGMSLYSSDQAGPMTFHQAVGIIAAYDHRAAVLTRKPKTTLAAILQGRANYLPGYGPTARYGRDELVNDVLAGEYDRATLEQARQVMADYCTSRGPAELAAERWAERRRIYAAARAELSRTPAGL